MISQIIEYNIKNKIKNRTKSFIKKSIIINNINLIERYGENSWVLITGCRS